MLASLAAAAPEAAAAQGPRRLNPRPIPLPPSQVTLSEPGAAFLASAVLPGAGQLLEGKDRWVPYFAVEVWGWVSYINHKSHGESLERRYRDLAWSVARRFDPSPTRRDTTFTYYEAMAEFHDSGEFDTNRDVPGIQPPENDSVTFNGQQWRRAKALFLRSAAPVPGTPDYDRALQYYRENGIPPGYGWSWGDSNLEQQVFNRLISDSDDALRRATRTLGLILANHVASAIDALVTARLDAAAGGGRQIKIGSELAPAGGSILWKTTVRFPIGN